MENSIEKIWREHMPNNTMPVPRIKNLDELQSIHLVESFKKSYKTNVIILALTAVIVLIAFILGGVPLLGCFVSFLFMSLAVLGQIEINRLEALDYSKANQDYLKSLHQWLTKLLSRFSIVYKIWIPLFFIGFTLAVLQTNLFIPFIGETLLERLTTSSTYLIMGFPLILLGLIALIAIALSYFSKKLFELEMKSIYGKLIQKLDLLLKEFE